MKLCEIIDRKWVLDLGKNFLEFFKNFWNFLFKKSYYF